VGGMKLDLKLLATRFFQAKEEPLVPEDGVNRYLLDQVLRPVMAGKTLYIRDVDFGAFAFDDIAGLEEYHNRLNNATRSLNQVTLPVSQAKPVPGSARAFC